MTTTSQESLSRPWWSHLRFSVRTLAVLVLAIAAALGWVARVSRLQRQANIAILRAGGQVGYDYSGTGTWRGIRVPRWLGEALGIDYLGNIRSVVLQRRGSDVEVAHVANLSRLDYLDLHGTSVTDRGLAPLENLDELHWLSLDGTGITDAGLAHLKGLVHLQDLYLDGSRITDAGLKHLKGMQNLVRLTLQQTAITDAGLKHLAGLSRLQSLTLEGTAVTDRGIEELQRARPDLNIFSDRDKHGSLSRRGRSVSRGSEPAPGSRGG